MNLDSLDHVHLSVPDLERAQRVYGPWLAGEFTPVYGGEDVNALGVWNMAGGDFIQVLDRSRPVFGASRIEQHGLLSVSFRVADVDAGIAEAEAAGLRLRSRVGSEDIGLGKNVIQAQFHFDEAHGVGVELVEREIPGDPHRPMTESCVHHVDHVVASLEGPRRFLEGLLESPFGPPVDDEPAGGRSVRNERFGIQLTEPTRPDGPVAERLARHGPGAWAIGFHADAIDDDRARAVETGLRVRAEQRLADGRLQIELEPEAGVVIRLVERRSAAPQPDPTAT